MIPWDTMRYHGTLGDLGDLTLPAWMCTNSPRDGSRVNRCTPWPGRDVNFHNGFHHGDIWKNYYPSYPKKGQAFLALGKNTKFIKISPMANLRYQKLSSPEKVALPKKLGIDDQISWRSKASTYGKKKGQDSPQKCHGQLPTIATGFHGSSVLTHMPIRHMIHLNKIYQNQHFSGIISPKYILRAIPHQISGDPSDRPVAPVARVYRLWRWWPTRWQRHTCSSRPPWCRCPCAGCRSPQLFCAVRRLEDLGLKRGKEKTWELDGIRRLEKLERFGRWCKFKEGIDHDLRIHSEGLSIIIPH